MLGCSAVELTDSRLNARKHLLLSRELLEEKDFRGSFRENQKVISTSAESPYGDKAVFNIGLLYAHYANPEKDYRKSLDYFRRLVRDYPQSPLAEQAVIWIGILDAIEKTEAEKQEAEAEKENLKREITRLRQELKKRVNTDKYIIRSRKLLAGGSYREAVRENMKVLSMPAGNPFKDMALFNMGLVYAHFNNPDMDYKKSITYFSQLLRDYPQSPLAEQAGIWLNVLNSIERAKEVDIEIEKKKKELSR